MLEVLPESNAAHEHVVFSSRCECGVTRSDDDEPGDTPSRHEGGAEDGISRRVCSSSPRHLLHGRGSRECEPPGILAPDPALLRERGDGVFGLPGSGEGCFGEGE